MHTTKRPRAGAPARPAGRVRKDSASGTRPTAKYTTSAELSDLIRCYRHTKRRMAAAKLRRLEEIIERIASGVWSKWRHIDSREEFVQECWVNCVTKSFKRIEPGRNAFSYLTTCFINVGNNLRFDLLREGQGEAHYRGEYIRDERFQTFDPDPE